MKIVEIEIAGDVCIKCETDGGAQNLSNLKIQFSSNKLWTEGCHPMTPKWNFRIGEYCVGCSAFKKWTKQTPALMEKLKNANLYQISIFNESLC